MAMFHGQINVIELIKAITLIMRSITIGHENFPYSPLPVWGLEL